MTKQYSIFLFPALIFQIMVFGSCSSGENSVPEPAETGKQIRFDASAHENMVTRADDENLDPLNKYIQDFTVYGIAGTLSTDGAFNVATNAGAVTGLVFPNYKVWYTTNASTSNTDNWEYVGQDGQTIKYWDENQNVHYFWAIGEASKGRFETDGVSPTTFNPDGRVAGITFNDVERTATTPIFYTDPTLVKRDGAAPDDKLGDYGQPVKLVFKQLLSHIRIGFYEDFDEATSDGLKYTVTRMWFYKPRESDGKFLNEDGTEQQSVAGSAATTAYLGGVFPQTATVQLTYDYTDTEHPSTTSTQPTSSSQYLMLGAVNLSDGKLPDNSKQPVYIMNGESEYFDILPYENNPNTNGLTLKCDYEITIKSSSGAASTRIETAKLATVPAIYCKWKPNYLYTYIFKISDKGQVIVLYDVLVNSWEQGEESNQPWHNW